MGITGDAADTATTANPSDQTVAPGRRPRLPRRKVTSHGLRREVLRPGARYVFSVDVLACGHEIYADDRRPATRQCPYCAEGLPPGFHPLELRGGAS